MAFSLTLEYCNNGTIEERMKYISSAGFTHVNIFTGICKELIGSTRKEVEQFAGLLQKHKLAVDWVHAPHFNPKLYSSDSETWTMAVGTMRAAIDVASRLGAVSLIIHPAIQGFPDGQAFDVCHDRLKKALSILTE